MLHLVVALDLIRRVNIFERDRHSIIMKILNTSDSSHPLIETLLQVDHAAFKYFCLLMENEDFKYVLDFWNIEEFLGEDVRNYAHAIEIVKGGRIGIMTIFHGRISIRDLLKMDEASFSRVVKIRSLLDMERGVSIIHHCGDQFWKVLLNIVDESRFLLALQFLAGIDQENFDFMVCTGMLRETRDEEFSKIIRYVEDFGLESLKSIFRVIGSVEFIVELKNADVAVLGFAIRYMNREIMGKIALDFPGLIKRPGAIVDVRGQVVFEAALQWVEAKLLQYYPKIEGVDHNKRESHIKKMGNRMIFFPEVDNDDIMATDYDKMRRLVIKLLQRYKAFRYIESNNEIFTSLLSEDPNLVDNFIERTGLLNLEFLSYECRKELGCKEELIVCDGESSFDNAVKASDFYLFRMSEEDFKKWRELDFRQWVNRGLKWQSMGEGVWPQSGHYPVRFLMVSAEKSAGEEESQALLKKNESRESLGKYDDSHEGLDDKTRVLSLNDESELSSEVRKNTLRSPKMNVNGIEAVFNSDHLSTI